MLCKLHDVQTKVPDKDSWHSILHWSLSLRTSVCLCMLSLKAMCFQSVQTIETMKVHSFIYQRARRQYNLQSFLFQLGCGTVSQQSINLIWIPAWLVSIWILALTETWKTGKHGHFGSSSYKTYLVQEVGQAHTALTFKQQLSTRPFLGLLIFV